MFLFKIIGTHSSLPLFPFPFIPSSSYSPLTFTNGNHSKDIYIYNRSISNSVIFRYFSRSIFFLHFTYMFMCAFVIFCFSTTYWNIFHFVFIEIRYTTPTGIDDRMEPAGANNDDGKKENHIKNNLFLGPNNIIVACGD